MGHPPGQPHQHQGEQNPPELIVVADQLHAEFAIVPTFGRPAQADLDDNEQRDQPVEDAGYQTQRTAVLAKSTPLSPASVSVYDGRTLAKAVTMTSLDRRIATLGLLASCGAGSVAACMPRSARGAAQGGEARADLYNCEGCEVTGERPADSLPPFVQLARSDEPGERMRLTGRVMAADGSGPVAGVVIYAHHTNIDGLYANGTDENEWSRRNGRLRGWVRTGADGRYGFDTTKPTPYPDLTMPAHVHLYVQEPGRRPYYIDDVVFEGEFRVDAVYRGAQELRGGSGIIRLGREDGVWTANRDIRLEQHPV